jgi:hypothetical protein
MTGLGIGWESENPRQIPKFLEDSDHRSDRNGDANTGSGGNQKT